MVAVKRRLVAAVIPALLLLLATGCRKSASPAAGAASPAPAGAAAAAPPAPPTPLPAQLPPVLARVNGESVERWELENAAHGVESRAGAPMPIDRRDGIMRGLLD